MPAPRRERSISTPARFLGTAFGYLELVRPAAIDSQLKTARKNEILTRLGERYSKSFDEGRNAVAERLAELQGQREAEQEKSVAAIEKKKDQIKDELQKDRQKISDREEKAQTSSEQLRDATRELSVVQQQLGSLNGDRTRLGIQIVSVQARSLKSRRPIRFRYRPAQPVCTAQRQRMRTRRILAMPKRGPHRSPRRAE